MQNWFSKGCAIAFLLLGLFVLALSHPHQTAYACTATSATNPGPPPIEFSIEDRVALAPLVLEGTVVARNHDLSAQVEVHRYFKGDGPAIMNGVRYGDGAMCQSPLFPGGPIIIFISEWRPGDYAVYYFNGVGTLPATEENIQQVIAAVGQQPIVPNATPTPTVSPSEPMPFDESGQTDLSGALEICLPSLLPILMGIVIVKRRASL